MQIRTYFALHFTTTKVSLKLIVENVATKKFSKFHESYIQNQK